MIQIYLCDDNEILLKRYQKKLKHLAEKHEFSVSFSCFLSGEQLLFHLEENPNAMDIIFLDILMGKLNGIEVAKKLRAMGCDAEIIFLTSSEEFVFDSFDTSPLHYILKDIETEDSKLEEVFTKALLLALKKESEVFLCESAGQKKKIPLHRISFFEIRGRVVTVHFDNNTFDFYSEIDTIETTLKSKRFVRCHRSFVVNLRCIDSINKNEIVLTTGEVIPLGPTYARELKLSFSSSLSNLF